MATWMRGFFPHHSHSPQSYFSLLMLGAEFSLRLTIYVTKTVLNSRVENRGCI